MIPHARGSGGREAALAPVRGAAVYDRRRQQPFSRKKQHGRAAHGHQQLSDVSIIAGTCPFMIVLSTYCY